MEINYMRGTAPLFGSRPMATFPTYQTAAAPMMPASTPRPPAPTSAANLQTLLALSGQDRANAFLKGLGAMGPALIAAGAPSKDPGAAQRNIALAGQLRAKATQDDLARQRAANVQALSTQMALQKAAQEKALFDQKMQRTQMFNNLLGIPNTAAPDQAAMTPSAVGGATGAAPLAATLAQTPSAAVAMPQPQISAAAADQSQVQIGNVSVPRSVIAVAALTDDPGAEVSKYVQKINDPSAEFRPGGQLTRKGRLNQEKILRATLKKPLDFLTELDGKRRALMAALDKGNGLADLAAINTYQRLIDDAVVRGEDVRLIQQSQPLAAYFQTFVKGLETGSKLGDEQRKQLREAANSFISAINSSYVTRLENVKGLAAEDGLRWNAIWQGPSIESLKGIAPTTAKSGAQTPAPQTTPRPASRSNAPRIGSKASGFKLPHPD